MNNKLHKIAIATLMAMVIGIFSMNAFGQMSKQQKISQVTNYINYYNNLAQQWQTYLEQKVRPYYNDRTYGRWARQEYQKGFQQIESARNYVQHYQNQLMALTSAGPQVPSDCRYRAAGSISEHANGCGNSGQSTNTKSGVEYTWLVVYERADGARREVVVRTYLFDDGTRDRSEAERTGAALTKQGYKWKVTYGPKGERRF